MVTGDLTLVGSCSGRFIAFDRSTGEERWSYDTSRDGTPANFHGDPLVAGELVVVGSDVPQDGSGHLYAFDRSTGELRWRVPIAVPFDVVRYASTALTVSLVGEALAVDLESGRIAWRFREPGPTGLAPRSTPLLIGDRFYFAAPSGAIHALEAGTGRAVWEAPLDSPPNTSIVAWGDRIYVGTLGGKIFGIDPRSGATSVAFDTRGMPFGHLTPGDDCLLSLWWNASVGEFGKTEAPFTLACLRPETGTVTWRQDWPLEWMTFRPLLMDDAVVVGDAGGRLFGFALTDGAELWSVELGGGLRGLFHDEARLFVGSMSGRVYAVDRRALQPAARP